MLDKTEYVYRAMINCADLNDTSRSRSLKILEARKEDNERLHDSTFELV